MMLTVGLLISVAAAGSAAALNLLNAVDASHQKVAYGVAEDLAQSEALGLALQQRAASSRGYLLTGDSEFLEARRIAQAQFRGRVAELRARHTGDSVGIRLGRIDQL